MKKEDLIKLGLTEEVATTVANAIAEEMKGFIPKHRFDEVNNQKNEYAQKIEELSKSTGNIEELKQQIEATKAEMANKEAEYQTKIQDITINSGLKSLISGQVHDEDLVISLIDRSKIKIEEGKVIGAEEQLKSLKESKAFLFKTNEPTPQPQPGFIPKIGGGGQPNPTPKEASNLHEAVAEYFQTK